LIPKNIRKNNIFILRIKNEIQYIVFIKTKKIVCLAREFERGTAMLKLAVESEKKDRIRVSVRVFLLFSPLHSLL